MIHDHKYRLKIYQRDISRCGDKYFYFLNYLIWLYFSAWQSATITWTLAAMTICLVTKWPVHEKNNIQTAMFNFPPEIRKSHSLKSWDLFPKLNSLHPYKCTQTLTPLFQFSLNFFFKCRTVNSLGKNAVKTMWVWNWTDSYSYSTYFAAFLLFRGKYNKYNKTKAWVQPFSYLQYVCFYYSGIFTFS